MKQKKKPKMEFHSRKYCVQVRFSREEIEYLNMQKEIYGLRSRNSYILKKALDIPLIERNIAPKWDY